MRKEFLPYVNNKGTDQPAHLRSLISAFIVRCLGRLIYLVSISAISSLYLASVAAQAGLCLTWSQTRKTGFLVTRLKFIECVQETAVVNAARSCPWQIVQRYCIFRIIETRLLNWERNWKSFLLHYRKFFPTRVNSTCLQRCIHE